VVPTSCAGCGHVETFLAPYVESEKCACLRDPPTIYREHLYFGSFFGYPILWLTRSSCFYQPV